MAEQGIVVPLCDQDARAAAGPAWVAVVRALGPKLTFVRGGIGRGSAGQLDVDLLKRGIAAYHDAGLEVRAVLEYSLGPEGSNPNAALGYKGDPIKNAFIDAYTSTCIETIAALGADAPAVYWLGNEPNLQASPSGSIPQLLIGQRADPAKPSAMAPEAYWSLAQHAGYWIGKECAAVRTVYPAAYSCLAQFGTRQYDGWIGGHIDAGFAYLKAHGYGAPWPFSGLGLNMEGAISAGYAAYTALGMARHKTDHGIVGPTILGEWGVPNQQGSRMLDRSVMTGTFQALDGVSGAMSLYAMQALIPDNASGYGCCCYTYRDGQFIPTTPTSWYPFAQQLFGGA